MGLKRWHKEKWLDQNGNECGSGLSKGKPKCRPSKKVLSKTPVTWGELSDSEKRRAVADKQAAADKGEQFSKVRFSRIRKELKRG
jgi:hypothetical protein